MSTTGIQNYLSNVFRQVYTYDTTAALFTPRLELSNIDTYSGNSISVATAAIGDTASNVYVGSNAGNSYNFIQNDRNVTAVGFGAASGISNVSNSVYLGFQAGAGASGANAVIAIGASSIGGGISNIFIGNGTGSVGNSNIFIGHSIAPGNVSNQVRIGISNEILIAGDLASKWVGIGGALNPVNTNNKLDVSGNTRIEGALGIRMPPGTRTLDVNGSFRANNGTVGIDVNGTTVTATGLNSTMTVGNGSFVANAGFVEFIDASSGSLRLSNAVTRSTGGFASVRDSVLGTSTPYQIALTLTPGILLVSAIDVADSTNRSAAVFFAYTISNAVALSQHDNGDMGLAVVGGSLVVAWVSGGSKTFRYSITYFPLT